MNRQNCINNMLAYYISMIAVFIITNYVFILDRITSIWILNFFLFTLFTISLIIKSNLKNTEVYLVFSLSFMICELATILSHSTHILDSTKSLGLNLNIFVKFASIYFIIGTLKNSHCKIDDIIKYIKVVYFSGFVAALYNLKNIKVILGMVSNKSGAYSLVTNSFFDNKNTFGIFLGISIACGILLFRINNKKTYLIGIAFQLIMLISSFCRSALLFLAVFILVFVVSPNVNNKMIKRYAIIAVLLLIILVIIKPELIAFFREKVLRMEEYGDAGRTAIWEYVFSYFNLSFFEYLFGVGASDLNSSGISYMHNVFIEMFFTGGLIKIAFYCALFILGGIKISQTKKTYPILGQFCLAILIGYLVFGMFESVILFELGLIPYMFTAFIFFIPSMNIS